MKLSKRLKQIILFVPNNSVVADIGSDHALIPAYLIKNNITKKVIATDINIKPKEKALNNFNNIDYRVGNGLNPLSNDEIDTLIISGMGADTIVNILNNNKIKIANTVIISPNKNSYLVRKKMTQKRFHIHDESLVLDKKHIYEIIVFKKNKKHYSFKELWLGPIILKHKSNLFYVKYRKELSKYLLFYNKIPFSLRKLIILLKINILKKETKQRS